MRFRKYTDIYMLFESGSRLDGFVPRLISGVHYYVKVISVFIQKLIGKLLLQLIVYFGYIVFAINRLLSALNVSSYNKENKSVSVVQTSTSIRHISIGSLRSRKTADD